MSDKKDKKPLLTSAQEEEIRAGVRTVFEGYYMAPNNEETWSNIRESIIQLLSHMWENGKLAGAADQGFQVHLSLGQTMSREEVEQGKVKVNIAFGSNGEFTSIVL